VIETRFVVRCDRCSAELLPIRGETFASELDARAAMAASGWELFVGSAVVSVVACYGCADAVDDDDEDEP
jgi:hypothetical protein